MFVLLIQWEIHTKWRSYTENTKIVFKILLLHSLWSACRAQTSILSVITSAFVHSLWQFAVNRLRCQIWIDLAKIDITLTIFLDQQFMIVKNLLQKSQLCSRRETQYISSMCSSTRLSLSFASLLIAAADDRATSSFSIIVFKKSNQHLTEHALIETSFKFSTESMNIFNVKYSTWTLDSLLVIWYLQLALWHFSFQITDSLACYLNFLHVITEFLELFRKIISHHDHEIDRFFQSRCIVRTSFELKSWMNCQSERVATSVKHVWY